MRVFYPHMAHWYPDVIRAIPNAAEVDVTEKMFPQDVLLYIVSVVYKDGSSKSAI